MVSSGRSTTASPSDEAAPPGSRWAPLRARACRPEGIAAAVVLAYGTSHIDFQDFAALTADPFKLLPDPQRQFLHSSPLSFFLGWPFTHLLGHNVSYVLVTLAGVLCLLLALRFYLEPWPAECRDTILRALLAAPLLLVLLHWLGKSDTFVLALFLAYRRLGERPAWAFVLGLLIVLGHQEIGTVILIGDALLRWRLRPALALGLAAGFGLVHLYHLRLSGPVFSRLDLGLSFVEPALSGWIDNPVTHLALGLGWFWLLVALRWREPDRMRVAAAILLAFAAAFTTADFTRDFILCAAPVLLYTAEQVALSPAGDLMGRAPFAMMCLVQAQIVNFEQVRDATWPATAFDLCRRLILGEHG